MRKITLILFVFVSYLSYGQIKVSDTDKGELIGKFKYAGILIAELKNFDGQAFFTYKDMKFQKINEYKTFIFPIEDIDTLHSLISDFKGKEKGDSKTIELPNGDTLFIEYKKTMGKMYAEVLHHSKAGVIGQLRWMTSKQAAKLFGKKK